MARSKQEVHKRIRREAPKEGDIREMKKRPPTPQKKGDIRVLRKRGSSRR